MNFPPETNIKDSQQNAFVQDWLSQWQQFHIEVKLPKDPAGSFIGGDEDKARLIKDYETIDSALELIQETYDHGDHEARKDAVATGGDLDATTRLLEKLKDLVPDHGDLYNAFELTYAFINAVKQIGEREN
jgi:hypothetical protein